MKLAVGKKGKSEGFRSHRHQNETFSLAQPGKTELDEPPVCLSVACSLLCAGGPELEVKGWLWLRVLPREVCDGFRLLFYGIRVSLADNRNSN